MDMPSTTVEMGGQGAALKEDCMDVRVQLGHMGLGSSSLGAPVLTPFNTSSRWSRNCMNKLIFQLVLQFTELTYRRVDRLLMPRQSTLAKEQGSTGRPGGTKGRTQPGYTRE